MLRDPFQDCLPILDPPFDDKGITPLVEAWISVAQLHTGCLPPQRIAF